MNPKNIPYSIIGILSLVILVWISYIIFPHIFMMNHDMMGKQGESTDIPFEGYSEAMNEHCQMMPEMSGCERYVALAQKNTPTASNSASLNDLILTDDATTIDAKPTEVVDLKDGQIYDLMIQKVRKQVKGKTLIMLSYNGSIPGPTFRAPQGAQVTFRVKNTVAELASTIHPHGLRLNYLYDGVPKDQGGSQDPIKTGEVYEQVLDFPDVGTFWYHPHTRDDFEQELWEYGTFVVYNPSEEKNFDSESVIVLDDILLDSAGNIVPFASEGVDHTLMGRYGNTVLINGETNYTLTMKQGEVKRISLVNTANARPFDFTIPGIKMKLVSWDMGYYQKESWVDHIIIAPAERYTIDIMPEKVGDFEIQSIGGGKKLLLGTLKVTESKNLSSHKTDFETLKSHDILGNLDIEKYQAQAHEKSLNITMTMKGMEHMWGMNHGMMNMENDSDEGIEWEDTMAMMNQKSTDKNLTWIIEDEASAKKNMDIDWTFQKGDLVKIRITNDGKSMHPMQHPFHMHGQRFLILDTNGEKTENFVWKDTVLIPAGQYVDILVDMSNPGTWMAHCHIVEHIFAGMMFHYQVKE